MKVYEMLSSIKGLEDGLYVSVKVALEYAKVAARKQGYFHKILEKSPDVVHLTVVDFFGLPQLLDDFTYQDAIIRSIDIIER